ncbi:MAG: KEOPS complex subunit Pcc1 [Candidatus Caldarchaeum sp.]|jgi:tRNA threonylcarbamoyladenosine modification (KEOPS) complex  Pcc1 subunit|uniref:KEOPS complex subunit n=1 Tax=Caldiarchaeum subterraneum TaxID=311458 RepID=A0A7C4I1E2_CALS0|nr:KEOPS complex subunit Pcc1 [Candidatus Caldarchaeales archaeon]MDJ0272920.1 KEOPS complex subunit Pcc1 [Candidatus Caldarchaeales archaeon]
MSHPVKVRSRITISPKNSQDAEAIYNSLKPDDKPLPRGLFVETRLENNMVVVDIVCERGLASFLATVDDILRSAALSEKAAETLRTKI